MCTLTWTLPACFPSLWLFFKYDFDLLVLELYLGHINSSAHIFADVRLILFIFIYCQICSQWALQFERIVECCIQYGMLSMKCVPLFCIPHFSRVLLSVSVCMHCTRLTSVLTKCDPCMIWEMSHSNPKVLFTFQFGSRIVPVLREQDLRKSTSLHRLSAKQSLIFCSLLLSGSHCCHWLSGCS